MIFREAVVRYVGARQPSPPDWTGSVRTSRDLDALVRPHLTGWPTERILVVALDAGNRPLGFHVVSLGGTLGAAITPADAFRFAIMANAARIVMAHNHPSGDLEPSREDLALTKQIADAGTVLGVPLLDHLVVTDEGYTSLADTGHL